MVPGVPRYHNPHCLLIRFMGQDDLDQMTLDAARQAGCTPCRACLPDQPEANPELSRDGLSPPRRGFSGWSTVAMRRPHKSRKTEEFLR